MNRALRKKYLTESCLLWVALAMGVFSFCWFRVWVVGELDTAQFRQIIDLLPKDWRKFSPVDFDWLVSYLGRTSLTLDEPMLVMLVTGWAMIRGSDVVSGELSRGSMELLLSQPISRRAFYISHALWTLALLWILVGLAWLGMSLGIWFTSVTETSFRELKIPLVDYRIPLRFLAARSETIAMASVVNPLSFLPGVVNLFCLGVMFGGLAACCSACDRYRWRTLGIVAGFYFANAGLKLLGMASEKFHWIVNFSVFGLYSPAAAIERAQNDIGSIWGIWKTNAAGEIIAGGTMLNCGLLLGLGIAFYVAGAVVFERRDLPAPV